MAAEGAASWMVAIWDLVAQQAAGRQARVSVQDVCAAAVAAIQVSGAGVLAVSRAGAVHVIWATVQVSKQLADIELTVGEGPRADASAFGGPVLASDLGHDDIVGRWPAFAPAAQAAGAAAIFAFPLQIGAIRVGVLEMYRRLPSPLSTLALGDALLFADTATLLLLEGRRAGRRRPGPRPGRRRPGRRRPGRRRPGRRGSGRDRESGGRGRPWTGRTTHGARAAPGRNRPGHRDAHGAAGHGHRRGVRPAAGLRLRAGPATRRRRARHRDAPAAAGRWRRARHRNRAGRRGRAWCRRAKHRNRAGRCRWARASEPGRPAAPATRNLTSAVPGEAARPPAAA